MFQNFHFASPQILKFRNEKYRAVGLLYKIISLVLFFELIFLAPGILKVQAQKIEPKNNNTQISESQSSPVKSLPQTAPQINVAPEIYYPLDETLYLEGRSESKGLVELYFEKPGSNPVHVVVQANSNGEWFLAQKLELSSGEWMVRARLSGDPPSDWSNPRLIQARITGFIVGSVRIKYAPVAAVLILLFLIGGGLLVYAISRVRAVKRGARERELREGMEKLQKELRIKDREAAEVLLEQHFSEIREGVLKELEHFDAKAAGGGELSSEEEEHRTKLLHELREAEESIQKKLKEIR